MRFASPSLEMVVAFFITSDRCSVTESAHGEGGREMVPPAAAGPADDEDGSGSGGGGANDVGLSR